LTLCLEDVHTEHGQAKARMREVLNGGDTFLAVGPAALLLKCRLRREPHG
jgi:hypothetical protein